MAVEVPEASFPDLLARAQQLAQLGGRRILGITGAPGAGKSTLARALADALGAQAALVGMDGFHLANAELRRLGRQDRKGAIDTFDAAGYVALLRRLREQEDDVVYAPEFRREIEEPIACAIPVPADVPLVITEGNYLLAETEPWSAIRGLADAIWHLELPHETRVARLMARHEHFGRSPEEAASHALGSDQRNAEQIETWRHRADLIVPMP